MCEKIIEHSEDNNANSTAIKRFLQHRWRFWIVAGMATIGVEKFLFEIITKHGHVSRSEVPIHVIADIAWCFLGEKGASFFKKQWFTEIYSQAISLAINGASHTLYEIWHHSMHHTHGHEHKDHNHTLLLLTLITIKIIWEQFYHNRQHITGLYHIKKSQ